jgi:hypothetical protein
MTGSSRNQEANSISATTRDTRQHARELLHRHAGGEHHQVRVVELGGRVRPGFQGQVCGGRIFGDLQEHVLGQVGLGVHQAHGGPQGQQVAAGGQPGNACADHDDEAVLENL